jgi:hypothetical protein
VLAAGALIFCIHLSFPQRQGKVESGFPHAENQTGLKAVMRLSLSYYV